MKKILLLGLLILLMVSMTGCGLFTEKRTDVYTEAECTELKPCLDVKFNPAE